MAKLSKKLKQQAAPKYSTRAYTRCRICFRNEAYAGNIPGVRKASW